MGTGTAQGDLFDAAHPPGLLCWSRMQAEAGQGLEAIVARKESEREAGAGSFFWGIGTSLGDGVAALAPAGGIPVVWSTMLSRPRALDAAPAEVCAWTAYRDADGAVRPLPPHVLVTSRVRGGGLAATRHYALACHSDNPLALRIRRRFDPDAYRNVGGRGAPIGASQVTCLIRGIGPERADGRYGVDLEARLVAPYAVRLANPVALDAAGRRALDGWSGGGAAAWMALAARLRGG